MLPARYARYLIATVTSTALLAACSNGPRGTPLLPSGSTSGGVGQRSVTETVIYSFKGGSDGLDPYASLIVVHGRLYGTTYYGGPGCYSTSYQGCGTVFRMTKSGAKSVLYSFGDGSRGYYPLDGAYPGGSLVNVRDAFYGITVSGGANGDGIVYRITKSGAEAVLHSFAGGSDGVTPVGNLINVGGTLYGTTVIGGTSRNGTVFGITPSGTERVVHSFGSGSDGSFPDAGLINLGGSLYGTTANGGTKNIGTVFRITKSGKETVLYSFGTSASDGNSPRASLINVGGALYGTTEDGGAYEYYGTVFSITRSGKEQVLHSFGSGSDGAYPAASLIDVGGTLYGTTLEGGTNKYGTVFSITKSGTETVLHSFAGGSDGAYPSASLIDVGGTLYGATENGGTHDDGTVFSIVP